MAAIEPDQLVAEMEEMVERDHINNHPLIKHIGAGKLTIDQLRGFAKQFYFVGPKPNPRPHCAVYAHAPEDPDIDRLYFEEVLLEEATGRESGTSHHLHLYHAFLGALGISVEEIKATEPMPETLALNHWRFYHALQGNWLEGIVGIAFIEGASARRNDIILNALIRDFGFRRGSDELTYWETHGSAIEEHHGDIAPVVIRKYATAEWIQNRVRTAVRSGIDLQWLFTDGVKRAYVDREPRYQRWW